MAIALSEATRRTLQTLIRRVLASVRYGGLSELEASAILLYISVHLVNQADEEGCREAVAAMTIDDVLSIIHAQSI